MATYTTYGVGQAEDVSNIITDIRPDCPFYGGIRTENISARIHEWQEDSLAAAADNKAVEVLMHRWQLCHRLRSHQQHANLHQSVQVSATADAVNLRTCEGNGLRSS